MVEHRLMHRLACHHCGHVMPPPSACPECGEHDSLVACGPGVERIADEVAELFPEARIAIVTSDTSGRRPAPPSSSRRWRRGEIDIIVGTQLVTKGYHFPELTLVGVVDADLGLRAATCAPPSAASSRSSRSPAAPGAATSRARCWSRPTIPRRR